MRFTQIITVIIVGLLLTACEQAQSTDNTEMLVPVATTAEDSFEKYGQPFEGKIAKSYEESEEWWPATPKPPEGTPNVVILLLDDTGFGHIGSFGGLIDTPNIDRLAKNGLRYNNFHTTALCSPSRASIMTGCYAQRVGMHVNPRDGLVLRPVSPYGLNPREVTIAEVLKPRGYATAIIGKWHLGLDKPDTPLDRGFGFFHGYLGDMMDDYYKHRRHGINYMRLNSKEIDPKGHATDIFSRWAIDYLNETPSLGN